MSPRPGRPRRPSDLDLVRLAGLLRHQQGVVARRQVIELGGTDVDVRRRLRRREWVAVHPGVYLDHTGPPTWEQRAWAAVLACWPAALTGDSALRAHGFRADRPLTAIEDAMHVMVAAGQSPGPFAGVRIERVRDPGRWLAKQSAVPRAGVEYAALKAAAKRTEAAAVALLGEVCQSRLTTPALLTGLHRARPCG